MRLCAVPLVLFEVTAAEPMPIVPDDVIDPNKATPVVMPGLDGDVLPVTDATTLLTEVTESAIDAVFADVMPVGNWANEVDSLSTPTTEASGRDVRPAPVPEMASARPNVLGRDILQSAAHAVAALVCAARVVAPPPEVRSGAAVSEMVLKNSVNSARLAIALLLDEPDPALPKVPSSNNSQPASAAVFRVSLISPVPKKVEVAVST